MPRLVGPELALEMITTGNPIPAEKAMEEGLVSEIYNNVSHEELIDNAIIFAKKILTNNTHPKSRERTEKISNISPDIFDNAIKNEADRIVEQAVQDTSNKLTGKDGSKKKKADLRNKIFNEFVEKRILPLVKKAIGKNTKTNKAFTDFVSKNFEPLRDIFLDQIDVQKEKSN